MKMTLRDKAGISGLWGCIFLFVVPIALGFWVFWSDAAGVSMFFVAGTAALVSFIAGGYFFADAANKLHEHSRERVAARRAARQEKT